MQRVVLLVLFGLLLGALLTGIAAALPGSHDLSALTWLGSVSTVAALVVAVGIYRVQQTQNDVAHQELLDALKAQDEILQDLTDTTPTSEPSPPAKDDDPGRFDRAIPVLRRARARGQTAPRTWQTISTIGDHGAKSRSGSPASLAERLPCSLSRSR